MACLSRFGRGSKELIQGISWSFRNHLWASASGVNDKSTNVIEGFAVFLLDFSKTFKNKYLGV